MSSETARLGAGVGCRTDHAARLYCAARPAGSAGVSAAQRVLSGRLPQLPFGNWRSPLRESGDVSKAGRQMLKSI